MAYIYITRRIGQNVSLAQAPQSESAWLSALATDPLAALNATETDLSNLGENAFSSWGGEVLTPSEQATINAQNAQAINQASGGNAALAQSEIQQSQQDTSAIAQQAQEAAAESNPLFGVTQTATSAGEGILAWAETNWIWLFAGVGAFLLLRPDKKLFR